MRSVGVSVAVGSGFRRAAWSFSFLRNLSSVAFDVHLEDGGVVDQAVDSRQRHSLIGEDRVPRTEGLVGGNQHGAAFISGADQLEQHAGLGLILGDVGDVVEDQQMELVELGNGAFEQEVATRLLRSLIPRLFLVPDCKDRHCIVVDPIAHNIAAVAKVNRPFPKLFRKIINHPTEAGMRTKYLHALPDNTTSLKRGISALRAQKLTQPLQIPDRCRSKFYLWHSGAGCSLSVPQLASH